MKNVNIGVIYPSRGMTFTNTFKEVLAELSDVPHTIYWSHGNTLPTCFNKPLSRALKGSHSHIWFIEDDMVIQKGVLKELIDADEDLIACDYPLVDAPSGTILYDENDDAFFSGTGCLLAKKSVLDAMPKPVFTSKIRWEFKSVGEHVRFSAFKTDPNKEYGMHDISFGLYHYMRGRPIKVSKTILMQRKLRKKGATANNDGADEIFLYNQYCKILPIYFPEKRVGGLLREVIIDGKRVFIRKDTSNKKISKLKSPIVLTRGKVLLDFESYPQVAKLYKEKKGE